MILVLYLGCCITRGTVCVLAGRSWSSRNEEKERFQMYRISFTEIRSDIVGLCKSKAHHGCAIMCITIRSSRSSRDALMPAEIPHAPNGEEYSILEPLDPGGSTFDTFRATIRSFLSFIAFSKRVKLFEMPSRLAELWHHDHYVE